ncbi:hypothetical protein Bhyg_06437 [Pseudolycoriella hygida]|uniref:G protein-coupled receptor n=1 Tax=Pseudolycoriella hygida TaxID=35572 RepID=A0A9Q0N0S5_9DIPT|nr:hypothetical protein Bhyg_06437 [Pseudolycoriella hygida]
MANSWFFNVSEIELGGSSVLGNNYTWFYIIHIVAAIIITISMTACATVIISIIISWRQSRQSLIAGDQPKPQQTKMEFVDRFPFYLAVADFVWGCSNLPAHLLLLITEKYPSNDLVSLIVAVNMSAFLGYQQLMHAGLAIYTYLGVVRWKYLDLGRGDWKIHLICGGLTIFLILGLLPFDSFGPSGYWMHQNVRYPGGVIFSFHVTVFVALQGFCTALGYRSIQRVVDEGKQIISSHISSNRPQDLHGTAHKCLATFVLIAICLYCPLSFIVLAFSIEISLGVVEPVTSLLIVIIGNSSGWANAVGYFRNRRIKKLGK